MFDVNYLLNSASPSELADAAESSDEAIAQIAQYRLWVEEQLSGTRTVAGSCDVVLSSSSPNSEYSAEFLQGMLDRMGISFHKYGLVAEAYPHRVNALSSIQPRIDKYVETKNIEWLMDVANFAMIEFMHPSVEGAHFEGTDSDQAPGRVTSSGSLTTAANSEISA